jgi:hypothetical protein
MRPSIASPCGNQGEGFVPQQLTIAFDGDLPAQHRSLKECVAACVYRQRGGVTAVAGRLDMQPSHLSEVLGGGGDRNRKFDLDELEHYITAYSDPTPVLYLVAKYLGDHGAEQMAAQQQLLTLLQQLPAIAAAAGVTVPKAKRR